MFITNLNSNRRNTLNDLFDNLDLLDDVFVNFDDDRDQKLIEILDRFGQNRQVIVLTCHQRSLKAYKNIGANQITI